MAFLIRQTLIYAIPLMIVALAGIFSERSGTVNLALEGIMVFGAFSGVVFVRMMQSAGWFAAAKADNNWIKLQGYLIDMVRAYDVQDRQTVVFTAKWIRGQGEATMDALTLAVKSFRPDPEYYEAAAANPRWAYTVTTTPGGEECYAFSDFQVTLPEDWKGKVCVAIHERSVSFYQAESYHLWQEKEGYAGGHLFSVGYSESEDFRNLPSFDELGRGDKGWYFLIFPTDFQPYADSERAVEEYKEMYGEISFIRDNAACF